MRLLLNIFKTIILWDSIWFPLIKNTFLYSFWHKLNGKVANWMYSNPSSQMIVIGVTGTDGKTTTCNMVHHIIQENLGNCVMVSTANIKFGTQTMFNNTKMTSLNLFDLNKLLAQAKNQGFQYAVIETSSHGLSQYRFEGINFSCGVLTNITPEHMDYHPTMEDYANTKKQLFINVIKNKSPYKFGVLPKDDEYGRKWIGELLFDKQIDYGITLSSTLKAENIRESVDSTQCDIKYLGKSYPLNLSIPATFNIYNALGAIGVGLLFGVSIEKNITSLSNFKPVDGRVNIIHHNNITHVIDFAHTPAALKSLLEHMQTTKGGGKIITVFGAPGLRDTYKRPEMGKIVGQLSDIAIITEDDSQTEDVLNIVRQVREGVGRIEGDRCFIQPNRESALKLAHNLAQPGGSIVYAGKGHEQALLSNFGRIPWNDMYKIKEMLQIT
ncbi:MAG TPA: UDP-N-acetylmuramoyl-L-alanyl-D-glutamate--2,6-diaminopimelate ligase [Candidatus Absconditabacterales bacterium]|nr:UDP-N-acetylmuramoyl-L-alanyl-D-glutamate--2,6-diaminopimelate ligase [Candidatus Absconditabacterales bacterium]